MYFAEETHEAIIDQETFDRAQEKLKELDSIAARREPRTTSAFSGMIVCAQCGGKYRRIKNHKYHAWNCATYQSEKKSACPGLQIREDVLYQAAADALDLAEFDERVFRDRVSGIVASGDHVLTFIFKDGGRREIAWETPSRKGSWTPEMREAARQRELERRRNQQ